MIKTNGDSDDVAKAMGKAFEALTKKKASEQKTTSAAKDSTVGFLELDTRSRDKRLKPSQSPERRGNKK